MTKLHGDVENTQLPQQTGVTRRSMLGLLAAASALVVAPRKRSEPAVVADETIEAEIIDTEGFRASARPTKLALFLKSRSIAPAHLARESGYSRQHLLRLRVGRMLPTKRCALQLTAACRRLSRERVHPRDLFDAWLPTLGGEA